ncbi:MAG TPA: GerMN domain-containing protein [Actinomycetota bacterium]|nr:GerMN domain-containing protein [Actinomycetota bacterium]
MIRAYGLRLTGLGAILCLAAGCGAPSGVKVIEDLPRDLYASPTPVRIEPPADDVRVFFARGAAVESVGRRVEAPSRPSEAAMTALLAGPHPDEAAVGLRTVIPQGTGLLGVQLSGPVATVDLSREFELGAEQGVLVLRLAQVVFTLTDLASIERVRFMIDGVPADVVAQDGALRQEPVSRSDYSGLGPAA